MRVKIMYMLEPTPAWKDFKALREDSNTAPALKASIISQHKGRGQPNFIPRCGGFNLILGKVSNPRGSIILLTYSTVANTLTDLISKDRAVTTNLFRDLS